MRRVAPPLAATLCLTACFAAEPKWIRLQSTNFELFTPAGERTGREAIRYLETVRSFFSAAVGPPKTGLAIRVVLFPDENAYHEYQPKAFAVAHYLSTDERDLIVIGRFDQEHAPAVIHEYVHLLVRHLNDDTPLWLNEGLAEFYSSLKPKGNQAIIGDLHLGRLAALRRDIWIAVERIIQAGQDSPYYNEKDKASAFYNESWALVHMLAESPPYRGKFRDFLGAIEGKGDSAAAFKSVYGKTVTEINRELREYVESKTFVGSLLNVKLEKSSEQPLVSAAAGFELRMTLADLLPVPEKAGERRSRYETLAREFSDRPEPAAALGDLLLGAREPDKAREWFEEAWTRDCRNAAALRRYARLLRQQGDLARAGLVLGRVLEVDPAGLQARLDFASVALQQNDPDRAFDILRSMRSVPAKQAADLFHLLALASLQKGDLVEADRAARRMAENAKTEGQTKRASLLSDAIARRARSEAVVIIAREVAEDPETARPGPPPPLPPAPGLPKPGENTIEGYLVEVRCMGERPRVRVETGSGVFNLPFPPADPVPVRSSSGAPVELRCGEWKRTLVRVVFELRPGADPWVRSVDFR
jgi:tetratricopeptide (TPR) repeat protein